MKIKTFFISVSFTIPTLFLAGCVVPPPHGYGAATYVPAAPYYGYRTPYVAPVAPPIGVQVLPPIGVAPGPLWNWGYHPYNGWGWHHLGFGWRHH